MTESASLWRVMKVVALRVEATTVGLKEVIGTMAVGVVLKMGLAVVERAGGLGSVQGPGPRDGQGVHTVVFMVIKIRPLMTDT
jgi:hypothetical protein